MKRFMNWLAVAAMTMTLATGCSKDDGGDDSEQKDAPVISMVGADIDQVHEITSSMSVKVNVKAPAGVKGFEIDIDSKPLKTLLPAVGLAEHMDLVNPATTDMASALAGFGFPVGDDAKAKTDLTFDISTLIPLIGQIYQATGDHKFTLTVTDAQSQKTVKTLMFHTTSKTTLTYNTDADLWKNTATVTVANLPMGAKVQYRVKDAEVWTDAAVVAGSTTKYELTPAWESKKNAAMIDAYTIKTGTGVFAATTYECRVANATDDFATMEFTTAAGDVIPNANMSNWSTIKMKDLMNEDVDVAYPNLSGDSFWGCGNNGVTPTLCVSTTEKFGAASPSAKLASMNMFVLASGNLFTGSFNYASFTGTVQFGQKYTYSARPSALKLKYHATVGKVDLLRDPDDDHVAGVAKGDQDKARIFVAIVDWTGQHQVASGMQTTIGAWDPEKGANVVTEGKVIGCGSMWITASTTGDAMQDAKLDIFWYDKDAKPASGNYSLVISCAANAYGDYMTGCSTNVMHVDDFQWVY